MSPAHAWAVGGADHGLLASAQQPAQRPQPGRDWGPHLVGGPDIRLADSGEFMGGVLRATGRVGMSMTRFSFLRPEAEELAAVVLALATGSGGVARPALVTSSWVP